MKMLGLSTYLNNGMKRDQSIPTTCLICIAEHGSWDYVKVIQSAILYNRYKDLILFNKNIIVAGICSFFSAAFVTQFYYTQYDQSHIANSIIALPTEYSVYIPLFSILFIMIIDIDILIHYQEKRFQYDKNGHKETAYSILYFWSCLFIIKNICHLSVSSTWHSAISSIYAWFISSINNLARID